MLILLFLATLGSPTPDLPHFPPAQRAGYAAYESALLSTPTRDSLLAYHQLLASEAHMAGTPGDARNIERLVKAFSDMGLDVQTHTFHALLARPVAAELEIISPDPVKLSVAEQPLPEDRFTQDPARTFGWNAYSGSGDVTGPIVYANYATKADFAKLAELNIDCRGKIVLARYGGNYRGFKAKFAEAAGAAGLIIYVDPADTGYMKGVTYPEGGYANSTCIERGSINTLDYPGDPLTPGVEATPDAKRLDPESLDLPKIPVQPIGYAAAGEIHKRMTGPAVPAGWQGGCPSAYRLTGGDELKVRLKVEQKRQVIPSANVIATLRGTSDPDTKVIIGCHHDAWICGAADPTCGTIALLESARSFAEQARQGRRPARTILFCAWGAEEFGIIGSTEWVEANRADLIKNAAMYINLDMASMGPDFGASTTPSIRRLIADAARAVPQPRDTSGKTVFDAWLARGEDALIPGQPRFGDLGGGSDHIGFLCHATVPSTTLGGHGSKGSSYHSTYDTLPWYWKVVGSDYEPALMVTRMATAVASRMANAPLLPLDPGRYGTDTRRALADLAKRAADRAVIPKPTAELPDSWATTAALATELESRGRDACARLVAALESSQLTPAQLASINRLLLRCDRAWLDEQSIPGRAWFKNLFAASDEDSGYGSWVLPGLRWAIEHNDAAALDREKARLEAILGRLLELMQQIDRAAHD